MNKKKIAVSAFVVTAVFFGSIYSLGVRFNSTPSIALGVYIETNKTPSVGDYVIYCPDLDQEALKLAYSRQYLTAGFCDSGSMSMMKQILAAKNDVVTIEKQGISVNGQLQKGSTQFAFDAIGREMPPAKMEGYTLKEDEIILFGDYSEYSYDSRYFGAVSADGVISVIEPLFTWK